MLDVESLLQPISDTSPTGDDLSFSPEFDVIQEARRSDDASLDQGEWITELKVADWPSVTRLCTELLTTRTKDLRLAAWSTEAMTHTDGFVGLAAGYRLAAGLCDRFWPALYPADEAGDTDLRSGILAWLLTHSVQWIRAVPLTAAPQGRFGANDIEAAGRDAARDGSSDQDGAGIEAACAETLDAFHEQAFVALTDAERALRELETAVDARLGEGGPSFTATREALDAVTRIARRAAGPTSATPHDPADDGGPAAASPIALASGAPDLPCDDGAISTREEALRQLQQIAAFFHRTEPHSPVAYLAERAARWGRMPLHVWLKAVLKDNPALSQLEELLGVTIAAPDADGSQDR
ncbi:MAG TPA: type VI secretion system protein TssA [Nevskiaceae bacterium]